MTRSFADSAPRCRPARPRSTATKLTLGLGVLLALPQYGCLVRGPVGLVGAIATTAIVTAAIVSATQPPPPRVIYVPEPRAGYVWDPGYWTLDHGEWVWVDGRWVVDAPGYAWSPTHWEQAADGSWRLVPGQWLVPQQPPPPPPPPPSKIPPPPPP
jgi:hypothetical protein